MSNAIETSITKSNNVERQPVDGQTVTCTPMMDWQTGRRSYHIPVALAKWVWKAEHPSMTDRNGVKFPASGIIRKVHPEDGMVRLHRISTNEHQAVSVHEYDGTMGGGEFRDIMSVMHGWKPIDVTYEAATDTWLGWRR